MRRLGTRIGPGSLAGILALAGCGPPFTAGTGGAGSTSSTTGTGSTGGSSGTTTSVACTPGMVGTCDAGETCSGGTCVPCTSLDTGLTFSFGDAQPIALTYPMATSSEALFPRVEKMSGALFFVFGSGQIARATPGQGQGTWGMATTLGPPYNPPGSTQTPEQEGPLPWADPKAIQGILDGSVSHSEPVLLFGSTLTGGNVLYGANLSSPPPSGLPQPLQAPFISGDRSVAVAFGVTPPRYFWLRDGQLVTTTSASGMPAVVKIGFDGGCDTPPAGAIADPWVRPDGARLLFSATSLEGSACATAPGSQARLFYVDLNPSTGQPLGKATQIFKGDTMDNDRSPSLSPDGCLLLFARSGVGNASAPPTLVESLRE